MSNYLAIATVTAALQRTLQSVIQADVEGARVTTIRPSGLGTGTPETGVNLYLYQVAINHIWRSTGEARNRNRLGDSAKRSQNALDLHYMLSFYGNEIELEPQRLLGSVMRTLNDRSTLTGQMIQDTLSDSNYNFLIDSDLVNQVEVINFLPLDLSLEDLSKVWSVFFQTPYALSMAYRATVVMIEGEESAQKALPVRGRNMSGMVPFPLQPKIEQVVSQEGRFEPILANSTLLIQGKNLKSDITQVRLGKVEVTPLEVTATKIILPLSSFPADLLRAGVQSVQVIHRISTGIQPEPNNGFEGGYQRQALALQAPVSRGVESNVAPFVLRPTLTDVSASNIKGRRDALRSADVTIQVDLAIGPKQRVVMALNEWSIDNPAAYLFEALPRQSETHSITIQIRDVKPAEYLVRLHVDGAESPLSLDTQPNSPTFNWYIGPKVAIL